MSTETALSHERLSPIVGPLVCQICRRVHPTRLDKNVCASTHPRSMRPQPFLACQGAPGCHERVFVGERCPHDGWLSAVPEWSLR